MGKPVVVGVISHKPLMGDLEGVHTAQPLCHHQENTQTGVSLQIHKFSETAKTWLHVFLRKISKFKAD